FEVERLADYLRMNFQVVDDEDKIAGEGRDLLALQEHLASAVENRFGSLAKGKYEKTGLTSWSFGKIPERVDLDRRTAGFPRLFPAPDGTVSMRLFSDRVAADFLHRLALARLFRAAESQQVSRLEAAVFSKPRKNETARSPRAQTGAKSSRSATRDGFGSLATAFGDPPRAGGKTSVAPQQPKSNLVSGDPRLVPSETWLLDQLGRAEEGIRVAWIDRLICEALETENEAPLTLEAWESVLESGSADLWDTAIAMTAVLRKILSVVETVGGILSGASEAGYEETLADAQLHYDRLLTRGWIQVWDLAPALVHWQGLEARLTRALGAPPMKDLQKLERYEAEISEMWALPVLEGPSECPPAWLDRERLLRDFDLRLTHFAPELRKRLK
ncbi:MAG: DUF3418 domain-containing protein, partial [Verrucomicrobiota bacterium]